MLIIGLVGKIGSGKDEVARFLEEERDFFHVSMGDLVRETNQELGREQVRENLQQTRQERESQGGAGFFAREAAKRIRDSDCKRSVVSGLRTPEDILALRDAFGKELRILEITTPRSLRSERLRDRGRENDPKTKAEFRAHEDSEERVFPWKRIEPLIEFRIENSGTKAKLFWAIDHFLAKLRDGV